MEEIQMMEGNSKINIVFICNDDYVLPTAVAIHSLIESKKSETSYKIYIIASGLLPKNVEILQGLQTDRAEIETVYVSSDKLKDLHIHDESAICVASIDALFKFLLPELLPKEEKVLYLDGDILVRKDLSELYQHDIEQYYAAVVRDSGSIYYKHKYVKMVEQYFNSGVMLLNLKKFREENLTEVLIRRKSEEQDSTLMDQNIFNMVFNGHIKLLPIKYNFLAVNLLRAYGKWSMDQINQAYDTEYEELDDIKKDAYIIHFSSKDKPWKYSDVSMADEWYKCFLSTNIPEKIDRKTLKIQEEADKEEFREIKVSIIIPVYNSEDYLKESIVSALCQTLAEVEVICVNDGSEDHSMKIMQQFADRDHRVVVIDQENAGQSVARNKAVRSARGEYVYFLDSDDMIVPEAMERLYRIANSNSLDSVLFEGVSFFETVELEEKYPQLKTYYQHTGNYETVFDGQDLYVKMMNNLDFRVSPCLQFVRRQHMFDKDVWFPEGIIHEDNYFSFLNLISCDRVMCVHESLFIRRVRAESTVTQNVSYKNIIGYYVSAYKILETLHKKDVKNFVTINASRQVLQYLRVVDEMYRDGLSDEDREILEEDERFTGIPYQFLLKPFSNVRYQGIKWEDYNRLGAEKIVLEKRLKDTKKKYNKIRQSMSYRIGMRITWLPRKIQTILKCLKKGGIREVIRNFGDK